jgi:hypothetical protein
MIGIQVFGLGEIVDSLCTFLHAARSLICSAGLEFNSGMEWKRVGDLYFYVPFRAAYFDSNWKSTMLLFCFVELIFA